MLPFVRKSLIDVRIFCPILSCIFATVGFSLSASETETNRDAALFDLPLEDLMRMKVTTASRKTEHLADADAAVFVITADDIARSGATTIADALRLSPGLQVARIDPHEWAVSARGFNGQFANKLLVLVDGRSVYTPLHSGVNWDTVDTLIHDVDRIEVVRGPGGALWGANAVNGVINIITKSARETQGAYLEAGGGTFERDFAGVRYGAKAGDVFFRVYGKYFDRTDFPTRSGGSDDNSWRMGQGGFRADWSGNSGNAFTVQGDIYDGEKHERLAQVSYNFPYSAVTHNDVRLTGGNLLGRWTHDYSEDSQTQVQAYYDRFSRSQDFFSEDVQTFDVDLQHRFFLGERHDIVAGLGSRLIYTDLSNGPNIIFTPEDRLVHLPSAFVQDEITLLPDKLRLTLGSKIEHHYFTGWNYQPNGRLLWTPHPKHSFWGAVSRAVRTPSIGEHDARSNFLVVPGSPLTVYASDVSGHILPEDVVAYELGYRIDPICALSFDFAAFYNVYNRFTTFEPGQPFLENTAGTPRLVVPFDAQNKAYGETYGIEIASHFKASEWWRLDASYSFLQIQLHNKNSLEPSAEFAEKESPHHQATLMSTFILPWNTEISGVLRYVDSLEGLGVSSYVTADFRVAWKPSPNWELSFVAQNLFDAEHAEFRTPSALPSTQNGSEVPRGFYGKLAWNF